VSAAIAEASIAPRLARRGALFVLALWGRHFPVYPQAELQTPALRAGAILLPSAWRIEPHGAELYRAAACHAAAHLIHAGAPFLRGELKPRQQVLIGLFEDARVEALAMARFPGLRRLWQCFHTPARDNGLAFPRLLRRLARALLLAEADAGNAWVNKAVAEFHGQSRRWADPALARELGLRLAHDLGQMRIAMDEGQAFQVAPYRDDNAHLWADEDASLTSDEPRSAKQDSSIQESVQWREARVDDGWRWPTGRVRWPSMHPGGCGMIRTRPWCSITGMPRRMTMPGIVIPNGIIAHRFCAATGVGYGPPGPHRVMPIWPPDCCGSTGPC
jgi:hypothetical protein